MAARYAQLLISAIIFGLVAASTPVDFRKCLAAINHKSIDGKTDNHGNLVPPTSIATAITYDLCVSQCGTGQEPFQWSVFSQQFSSWLLPWLALVPQLPFGANNKLDNLESMLLTLGSPTLAAYSLALTVLNRRWIYQLFSNYEYPNVIAAMQILSSLQQSPLQVETDGVLLTSLIMLPKNDKWWAELVILLDFTHTWTISAATSIAWVIIACGFTIADYFPQGVQNALLVNSNGQGVGSIGSLWFWLLPIVVGWLQLSPKCDSIRLHQAVDKANSIAYVANTTSKPIKAQRESGKRAISIKCSKFDEVQSDERSTPPIFNYARFLPWTQAVVMVSDTFGIISERDHHHDPVIPGSTWRDRNSKGGDALTASQLEDYGLPRPRSVYRRLGHPRGLDSSAIYRILIASTLALTLQWGTTGAAIIIVYFTPTIGLGCRSVSYIVYGVLSTLVWMMLLTSSILTYYSTNIPTHQSKVCLKRARRISIFLRRSGKCIAAFNAVWIVATCLLQFSNFYDRCYCNSSVMGLGKRASDVIDLGTDDLGGIYTAWIGAFVLAVGVVAIFAGFVTIVKDPPRTNDHNK